MYKKNIYGDNLSNIENKILYICSNEYQNFLSKDNVVGLGLGSKIKNGFLTNEPCIKVFVSKKVSIDEILKKDIIPRIYNGLKTDVVESGKFKLSVLNERVRPTPGGYSIEPCVLLGAGTMGCLVKDSGNKLYILSNEHVMVEDGTVPLSTPILQPGTADGGIVYRDTIANLAKYIPVKYTTSTKTVANYVDCAIGHVKDISMVSPEIYLIGRIQGVNKAKVNQTVEKSGRTTDVTEGEVVSVGTTISEEFPLGKVIFKDQIATTHMSEAGDSGAVVLNLNREVIGLMWAQSKSYSLANNIEKVLSSLGVTIVTN